MGRRLRKYDVLRIPAARAGEAVDVLSEAFEAYPVMRFVLGDPDAGYPRRLHRLVDFFVRARLLREEPVLGVEVEGTLLAAATVSDPGNTRRPRSLALLREEVWSELGPDARSRYEACGAAWQPLGLAGPHLHLNMVGVRRAARGLGLARHLVEAAQELSRATPGSLGVTLTTEDPGNLPFYQRAGYQVVGHAHVAAGLETWAMFRPNDGAGRE